MGRHCLLSPRPRIRQSAEWLRRGTSTTTTSPVSHFMRVDVDSIDYKRWGPPIEFTFGGNFEASLSASLVQDNFDGVGR